jgi:hypothetical protein
MFVTCNSETIIHTHNRMVLLFWLHAKLYTTGIGASSIEFRMEPKQKNHSVMCMNNASELQVTKMTETLIHKVSFFPPLLPSNRKA